MLLPAGMKAQPLPVLQRQRRSLLPLMPHVRLQSKQAAPLLRLDQQMQLLQQAPLRLVRLQKWMALRHTLPLLPLHQHKATVTAAGAAATIARK